MRIAEIAPAALTVPPDGYGGIEWVVSLLTEGLTDRGHDVTLFAAPGSSTDAKLVAPLDDAPGTGNVERPNELTQALKAYLAADEFDVIHDHSLVGPAVGSILRGRPPVFHTLHGSWTPTTRRYYGMLHDRLRLVAISNAQRSINPDISYAGTVYNAVDLDRYPFRDHKDRYLLFVGRVNEDKGPDRAVDIAHRVGLPLKMVIKRSERAEKAFWEQHVAPRLHGDEEVFENIDEGQKLALYAGAAATLFPIRWDEPFGLVMIESLACGTPVVACSKGAAPEVVRDGATGFLRNDDDSLAEAARHAGEIDPEACRSDVAARFSAEVMVGRYESLFEAAAHA